MSTLVVPAGVPSRRTEAPVGVDWTRRVPVVGTAACTVNGTEPVARSVDAYVACIVASTDAWNALGFVLSTGNPRPNDVGNPEMGPDAANRSSVSLPAGS